MKTGLNLQPISEEIVRRVMEQHSFTKLSPAINFIIAEYSRLTNGDNTKPKETPANIEKPTNIETKDKTGIDFSSWFIAEEK